MYNLSPPKHPILPFYLQPNFLQVHPLALRAFPYYAEKIALAFANESSKSSLHCSTLLMHYDSKVLSYLDISAYEYEDS